MTEHPHATADISAVTPAQRARILREESIWIEEYWQDGCFDGGIKDLMVSLSRRIEDLEAAATAPS